MQRKETLTGFLGELFLSERERHAPLADALTQLRS